jgi:hypothetical protein
MKTYTISENDALALIENAEDFGHDSPEFYTQMFKWVGQLTDKQIHGFANSHYAENENDVDVAIERLTYLNEKYGERQDIDELLELEEELLDNGDEELSKFKVDE